MHPSYVFKGVFFCIPQENYNAEVQIHYHMQLLISLNQ